MDLILLFGWVLLGLALFFEKWVAVIALFGYLLFAGLIKHVPDKKENKEQSNKKVDDE